VASTRDEALLRLTAARIEPFLARFIAAPDPDIRALLLYGPDQGLVCERADDLARAIVADLRDPFRVAALGATSLVADPALLADETQALSLTGGRRVLRVKEAGDAVGGMFERWLKSPGPGDTLVVVEAGDLPLRSSLRRAFEAAKNAAAIPCYGDGPRELRELARAVMAAHGITIAGEALDYLAANLGGDRGLSRQELEKLALYVGDGGRLGYGDAAAVVGDSAALTLEDVVHAASGGDAAGLERALSRAFEEGEAPVTVLRALTRHFQRLHLTGARIAAGAAAEEAMGKLRPPVFFKDKERFGRELRLWPKARAQEALLLLTAAERNAKRTGPPPDAICRDALLRIARSAVEKRR
jgi:DNA polymerase-3 subunit delta